MCYHNTWEQSVPQEIDYNWESFDVKYIDRSNAAMIEICSEIIKEH